MGAWLSLALKYGIPALMQIWPLIKREIDRRQLEKETGEKIQHAFYSEKRRVTGLKKEDLLQQ